MISHRRLLSLANLLATVLLCWLPAIAQTSPARVPKPGTISGRVVNENGRPLPDARIVLRRLTSMNAAMNTENLNTTTDREGRFEMKDLQPVNYQIFAFLPGYAPLLWDMADDPADIYRVGDSVTLVLTKGGVITGTVTNQEGEPVVGVNVRALIVRSAGRLPSVYDLMGPSTAATDDRGIYRIYGLSEGTYLVRAGGGSAMYPGGMSANKDSFESDVPTYAPASTKDTAEEIVVRAGAETSGVDIQYRGEAGHTVSGIVSGPKSDQLVGFGINLVSAGGRPSGMTSAQRPGDRGFMFEGVDDGEYSISAVSYSLGGEFMFSPVKQIRVRGADVSGVELAVEPLSSVAGRVVLEETKTTECTGKQRPIFTETLISAKIKGNDNLQHLPWFLQPTVSADERGNVLLKNLSPGRYYFTTQHFAKDWYLKSLSFETASTKGGKPLDAARNWTTLKPGDRLNGLTITLTQGAASLGGHIVLGKGETAGEKLFVFLVPAEKESADDPLRFYRAAVTAEGKVALTNLAPGRYLVFAQEVTDESLPKLRSPDGTAFRATLRREAETLKAEIELRPCQKIVDLKVRVRAR